MTTPRPPDLPELRELRDFIRGRRAALYGFLEQGAELALNGDVLTIIPRNDIYIPYLNDNRNVIADLASELYERRIRAELAPLSTPAAAENGNDPADESEVDETRNGARSTARRAGANMPADEMRAKIQHDPQRAYEAVLGASLARKSGSQELVAPCPLHNDTRPSLRVNLEKATWYCDPCARGGDLFNLAQTVWGFDFPKTVERLAGLLGASYRNGDSASSKPRKPAPQKENRKVVRRLEYPYEIRDLDGTLKATHDKIEFSDGTKEMPWDPKGVQPRELPLFQIEKTVDSADGETIILCEGETPAASLWKRRVLAVGTVCGADRKGTKLHCDESLRPLTRFDVVLWPDNDEAGRNHMRTHGAALVRLGCKSVRCLCWPEAPPKGDAADFEGDVDALLDSAEAFEPAKGDPDAAAEEREWEERRRALRSGHRDPPREETKNKGTAADERVPFDAAAPVKMADYLRETKFTLKGVPTLHHFRDEFLQWNGSRFVQADGLSALVGNWLADEVELTVKTKRGDKIVDPTRWQTNEILAALAYRVALPSTTSTPTWLDKARGECHIVALANGLFDLDSGALYPPTPTFFNLTALPVTYRPDAGCPQWLQLLNQLWPQDNQAIETLQEIMGYLLEPDNSQQKIFVIVGPPRSGKGTCRAVIEAMLGAESVCKLSMSDFASRFGLEPTIGKLVAIVPDGRLDRKADIEHAVEQLLSRSGDDSPPIERKYKTSYAGATSRCRILLMFSEFPTLRDSSGALAARLVLLRTFESFVGREDTRLFEDKLRPEIDGIFLWAVEGWRRLRKRRHFVVPESAQGLLESVAEQFDKLSAFMADCIVLDPTGLLEKSQVYERYLQWARGQGRKPLSSEWFFRTLGARANVDCAYRPRSPDGKLGPRQVKGIRFKIYSDTGE
jgi:P4 family phage/plasmid primase-like protien